MTNLQTKILYILVREAKGAKPRRWHIPTGRRAADLLHENGIRDISPRTANDHIRRLARLCSFRKRKNAWYVVPRKLVTEPETALFLLAADRMASDDPERRILKERLQRLHLLIQERLRFGPQDFETLYRFACDTGYLEEFPTIRGLPRIGDRTEQEKRYLELLVGQFDVNSLIGEILERTTLESDQIPYRPRGLGLV
jgi:hypothetical protein